MDDSMRNINPTFTDDEFKQIDDMKTKHGMNWHDFVIHLVESHDK